MSYNPISGKTITELYRYLQTNGGSYNDLRNCFRNSGIEPNVEALIEDMLQGYPVNTIQREWDRAKLSVLNDPADTLTAASSMIEATYKYLLHDMGKSMPSKQDMRSLSKAVHQLLKLSPEQESDEDFRSLLQGTITISQSLSSIRTKIGDAHGASPTRGNPTERHARLAINSAGAICVFLLETYNERKEESLKSQ